MSENVEKFTDGPAFPTCYQGPTYPIPFDGMSLRDYFAGQALIASMVMASSRGVALKGDDLLGAIANAAYVLADALLAERAK